MCEGVGALSVNRARSSPKRALTAAEAKARLLAAVRDGLTVVEACALVDRTPETYRDWRRKDPTFAADVDAVRQTARAARARSAAGGVVVVPDFPEFCEEYLGQPLPLHHQRIWDVLNGRDPREMHPAIRYQEGRTGRLLVTLPPYHAKTQVWSVNYAVWRMVKDPNVRIAVISQTQDFARKIVHQVKQILTMPQYAQLQRAFMPEGGWKGEGWTKTHIYLSGVDTAQNDPTLQALGVNGQVYGSRLDVILCDDLVTGKNVHTYKQMADWIGSEVSNRMDDDGVLHVLGTRMGPNDLYSELRDLAEWDDDRPVWTHFAQPAVLEEPSRDPRTWVTLWPEKWPGEPLARLRAEATETRWLLTYQQLDASIDQVFPTGAVNAAVDAGRAAGPQDGLHVVLGVDPASAGFTAMVVLGYDRVTGRRLVLDGFNQAKCPPELLMSKIRDFVARYQVREVIVERNAFQGFLSRQRDLIDFCYAHGALLTEHYTGSEKWSDELGIAALAPLFLSCAEHDIETDEWTPRPVADRLITLPNPRFATFVDQMIAQLTTWQPRERVRAQTSPTDLVMALWFANIGVQKVIDRAAAVPRHLSNPFLTRADARDRAVVNLVELAAAQARGESEVSFVTGEVLT